MSEKRAARHTWLYRALLRLYPREFRQRYGSDMLATFALRAAEVAGQEGALGSMRFFLRELVGLVGSALHERLVWLGIPRRADRRRARGSVERVSRKEPMSVLILETRHAMRRLVKNSGFTVAAIFTLALGIGANTAIYSVVYSVVLSPLPYPESERLVWLDHAAAGIGTEKGLDMTNGLYVHYGERSRTLEEMAIYLEADVGLTGDGTPERLSATIATHTLFATLRVPPLMGRTFDESDDYADGTGVVVLSHDLWTRRYGADPSALGRTVQVEGTPLEIIGVMPPGFAYPSRETKLWAPLVIDPAATSFGNFSRRGIARMSPGATPDEVEAELNALIPRLTESFPSGQVDRVINDARLAAVITTLKESLVGDIKRTLWILLGTVAFVLLIACANVANLFLVRAEARQREMAVRTALGAGRGDLVRHFLTESTLLAIAGGALGLLFAFGGVQLLRAFGPDNLPRLHEVGIDGNVLIFTAAVSLLASLIFGAIPIVRRTPDLVASLKEGARGMTTSRGGARLRSALVASQVALALMLLVGAGLMARSFWHLSRLDLGFNAEGVLTFQLGLPRADYPSREAAVAFHRELLDRLEGLPGVESAAAITCLVLCGSWNGDPLQARGSTPAPGEIPPVVATRRVSAGYFETMRIPLLEGRTLERADQEQRTGAAVVSAELVERYWPGESGLEKRVYHSGPAEDPSDDRVDVPEPPWYTIVGVVANTPVRELTEDPAPIMYYPLLHSDSTRGLRPNTMTYVVRSSTPPLTLAGAVRNEVWSMDENLPIARTRTMERIVSDAGIQMAFTMVMLVIAAFVALLLGAVGIYGVVSYVVAQRTGEIGVRMALGARAADVSRMVLRQGGSVVAFGLVLGLVGAFALTRLMRALLFGISPTDPGTFAGVSLLLAGIALLASYVPARRAARVDPVQALRSE